MAMFDLLKIKEAVESLFDVELTVEDICFREGKELRWKKGNDEVTIRINKYVVSELFGKEHIHFDYWNGTGGRSSPCDSLEQLIDRFDQIGMPRKRQISIWEV